jgi:predicted lipoprotein with Yx(FWY)xxD motif
MARVRPAVVLAVAATSVALMAGCGGSTPSSTSAPAAAGSQSTGTRQLPPVGLIAKQAGQLGVVVTDSKGWTLYRYDKDTSAPPASTCDGPCAAKWPPVIANDSGQVQVNGVDANLVDTVTRTDGSKQVTINGWPVYRFSGDTAPGDTKGEGVVKLWYAVSPLGKKAGAVGGS